HTRSKRDWSSDVCSSDLHCSGGAQTKILHFLGDGLRVVKNNLFPTPPLFKLIHNQSNTDWDEMYKVFNMGHRMELYLPEDYADEDRKSTRLNSSHVSISY